MKNKVIKITYWTLFILLFLIFGYSVFMIANWVKDNNITRAETKSINTGQNIKSTNITTSHDNNALNFQNLKKENKDTVAYIDVSLTDIHYPVVQTIDNKYYLNHSFTKKKSGAGWIFLDCQNSSNFNDDNTVIYGHNRADKTMFGSLENLLKNDLSQAYPLIYISLEQERLVYQIFSVYTIFEEEYYIQKSFSTIEEKSAWLDTISKRNTSSLSIDVNEKDKILTLSTCYGNNDSRLVVHAKKII